MNLMKQWLPDTAVKHSSLMPQAHPRMTQSSPPHMSGSPQRLYAMAALAYVLAIAAELLEGTALLLCFFAGVIENGISEAGTSPEAGSRPDPSSSAARSQDHAGSERATIPSPSCPLSQDRTGYCFERDGPLPSAHASSQHHGRLGESGTVPQAVAPSPDLAASSSAGHTASQPIQNYFATRGNIEHGAGRGCYHLLSSCQAFEKALTDIVSVSETQALDLKLRRCSFCWPANRSPDRNLSAQAAARGPQ